MTSPFETAKLELERLADELNRDPANIHAWLSAAGILERFGEFAQAEAAYRRVLAILPSHAPARFGLATMLLAQGALADAEPLINQMVTDSPLSADAWNLLASLRQKQVRDPEAAAALRHSLALRADPAAHSNLLQILQYADGVSPAGLLDAHRQWNNLHAPRPAAPRSRRSKSGPLRVGFVSADFGRHPTGFLTLPLLETLDPSRCSVFCYYDRTPEDDFTVRFRAAAAQWRVTEGWPHENLARQIQEDEIDILFDMMGHTGHRLLTFALRPAPVQVTWLGYVGTTGLSAMDFLLADRFHIRPGEEPAYTEKILRLPHGYACYLPPAEAPDSGPLPALAAGHVTLGCFNNAAKLSTGILDAWAEILHRLPTARLLIKNRSLSQPESCDRLHVHFATHGVPPQRVLLERGSSHTELIAAYRRVDLALDTQPYSGGLTTCEALWMGVPVITFPGATFAGRHSASHLSNAGCEQFIAADLAGYIDLAVHWASRRDDLAAIRGQLREQLRSSPLCDGPQFARDFLSVLQTAWED